MAQTKLKRAARARQKKTGERYTEALARVKQELDMSNEESAKFEDEANTGGADVAARAKAHAVLDAASKWLSDQGIRYIFRGSEIRFVVGSDRWSIHARILPVAPVVPWNHGSMLLKEHDVPEPRMSPVEEFSKNRPVISSLVRAEFDLSEETEDVIDLLLFELETFFLKDKAAR